MAGGWASLSRLLPASSPILFSSKVFLGCLPLFLWGAYAWLSPLLLLSLCILLFVIFFSLFFRVWPRFPNTKSSSDSHRYYSSTFLLLCLIFLLFETTFALVSAGLAFIRATVAVVEPEFGCSAFSVKISTDPWNGFAM